MMLLLFLMVFKMFCDWQIYVCVVLFVLSVFCLSL